VRHPVIRDGIPGTADGTVAAVSGLVADLGIRGLWQPQRDALIDIRVVDSDANSYVARRHTVAQILNSAQEEKKRKYLTACSARRADFTPFVVTCDGALGPEATRLVEELGSRLSNKWGRPYSVVIGWLRARITVAAIRATSLCIRGARTRWRGLGFEDGAPIDAHFQDL
jgi:hypothetical protein